MTPTSPHRAFALWTLAVTLVCLTFAAAATIRQFDRRVRGEALARVERAAARAVEAFAAGGTPPPGPAPDDAEVRLETRSRAEIDAAFGDARVPLWRSAIEGVPASRVFAGEPGAVAVRALPGDPVTGAVEARLDARRVASPVLRFAARAGAVTLILAAAAGALALAAGRRWTRSLAELEGAAVRWARGDLGAPAPSGGADEPGALRGLGSALERMRAGVAAAAAESERRRGELEAVVAGIAEGVFAVDRDRRIRYLSPRGAALLGVDAAAAVGRFCGDVLRPEPVGGERLCDGDCPILAARYRGPARALERLQPGDRGIEAVLTSSPPDAGIQVQVLREETADEAALRVRDELVADLAHELKTPLAAQRASLELLRDRLAESDAEATGLAAAAQSGTARLERLIENLLESVRIESGQAAVRRAEVDLEEVVEEAVSLTAPLIAKRKQRLEIDLAYPLPRPVGDAPRLVQVLVNLLANASKYAPEGSEIRLAAECGRGDVGLWVEDEGPGLDAALLAGEPARFRRGGGGSSDSGAARQPGDGLGLRIARSIVERHGAALEAERRDGRTRVGFRLRAEGGR